MGKYEKTRAQRSYPAEAKKLFSKYVFEKKIIVPYLTFKNLKYKTSRQHQLLFTNYLQLLCMLSPCFNF